MAVPNVTKFCDEMKFNRFHWNLLVLGVLTLLFDGYDSQILAYVMPNVIKEWHLTPVAAGSIVSYGLVGLMIGTAGLGMRQENAAHSRSAHVLDIQRRALLGA
jgi:AAHS family benzoate transporter-like MFS transporter